MVFDTINHNAILLKLLHFGFDYHFLEFFADYLSVFAVFMLAVYINDLPSLWRTANIFLPKTQKLLELK